MIQVRRSPEHSAVISFLFPLCLPEVKRKDATAPFTPEILSKTIQGWDILEFFDTKKQTIIGAAGREPNGFVHLYVDEDRRPFWDPHTSLQSAIDIFLSTHDKLQAGIPVENSVMISMVHKLGFVHTHTKEGIAFHLLTAQARRR